MSDAIEPTTSFTLVFGAKAGIQDAIEAIYVLYYPLVCTWSQRLGLQHSDAEDAAQEVMSHIERRLQSFKRQENRKTQFRFWLWRVTKNHVTDVQRKSGKQQLVDKNVMEAISEPPTTATDELPPQSMLSATLEVFLDRLSDVERKVLQESIANDRTAKDIAAEIGLTKENVYTIKSRTISKLRSWLQELESDLSRVV